MFVEPKQRFGWPSIITPVAWASGWRTWVWARCESRRLWTGIDPHDVDSKNWNNNLGLPYRGGCSGRYTLVSPGLVNQTGKTGEAVC